MLDAPAPPRATNGPDWCGYTLTFPLSLKEAAMAAEALRLFPDPDSVPDPPERELDALGYRPGVAGARSPAPAHELSAELSRELADPAEILLLDAPAARAAGELSLAGYFARHFRPWREARLAAGTVKKSSLTTEESHLRAYAGWDAAAARRPQNWPAGREWGGLPLSLITARWLRQFLADQVAAGWSPKTARSCWTSLRTVLNHARSSGVLSAVPSLPKLRTTLEAAAGDEDDDPQVLTYDEAALGAMYRALPEIVSQARADGLLKSRSPKKLAALAQSVLIELQTALVLGANCGPRPADLFGLEFSRHVRLEADPPVLSFKAAKTQKRHVVPLADVTRSHLERLKRHQARLPGLESFSPLFPSLTNHDSTDPMRSAPYRRSVQILRRAIRAAGLDETAYVKPWHSLRKTCTTRFNAHGVANGLGSVGKLITHGKDADVASQSYDNPLPTLLRAVQTIDWPAEFLTAVDR